MVVYNWRLKQKLFMLLINYLNFTRSWILAVLRNFCSCPGYGYGAASPHVSAGGSASHLGSAGSGLHGLPTTGNGSSHMGAQTIYHLSSLPPPPSIAEPGSNSLDDVLKAPGECEYTHLFSSFNSLSLTFWFSKSYKLSQKRKSLVK
jgi:hypothetical protein